MGVSPIIAVVVITNGDSTHLIRTFHEWVAEGFVPGSTLFFCGPRLRLLEKRIVDESIVNYVDRPYYRNNFHINDKKRTACDAINAKYIYIVHDRFLPKAGLCDALNDALSRGDVDFGAVDVDNEDGTAALRELRLKRAAAVTDIESAMEPMGRLTCDATDQKASEHVAINGGQFFLRKSLSKYLERPLRWLEMEDDVLSHDLSAFRGLWLKNCGLTTLAYRRAPVPCYSRIIYFKYSLYRAICNILERFSRTAISVGKKIDKTEMKRLLDKQFVLIDPLHKLGSSEFLPSSLEKLMARARLASHGNAWESVQKCRVGWKLIGSELSASTSGAEKTNTSHSFLE